MKKFTYIKNGAALAAITDGRRTRSMKKDLERLRATINRFRAHTSQYKNSWFWEDNGNMRERARKESEAAYSSSFSSIRLGIDLSLNFSISMSRKNVYQNKFIEINGEEKTAAAFKSIESEINALLLAWNK